MARYVYCKECGGDMTPDYDIEYAGAKPKLIKGYICEDCGVEISHEEAEIVEISHR